LPTKEEIISQLLAVGKKLRFEKLPGSLWMIFHFFSPSVPKGVQDVTQRQGIAIVPPKKGFCRFY